MLIRDSRVLTALCISLAIRHQGELSLLGATTLLKDVPASIADLFPAIGTFIGLGTAGAGACLAFTAAKDELATDSVVAFFASVAIAASFAIVIAHDGAEKRVTAASTTILFFAIPTHKV